jgi:GH15 family glucan-1,4-alpha-glucosidase
MVNHLVYRYQKTDDGLSGSEGTFGICNFWLAENLAKSGKLTEGVQVFEAVLRLAGTPGLLSEEADPETKEMLGNFPQGFTHIGLINAALTINAASRGGERA